MQYRWLCEAAGDEETVEVSIQKALSRAPLSVEEFNRLMETDIGSLISEYGLNYNEASNVLFWLKNEAYRLNAQSVTFGKLEDYDVRGRRPGSPGLLESSSRRFLKKRVRRIIRENHGNISKEARAHPLHAQSERHAKCWGHGSVVNPQEYSGLIQRGINFADGKSKSPLRMSEGQLRRMIRRLIRA